MSEDGAASKLSCVTRDDQLVVTKTRAPTQLLPEDPVNVEAPSLAKDALRGVAWNWGGSMVLILAQVASTAVTARLVSPSEFGLYAAALAASGFAGYFTLAGLGPGLQRRSQLGPRTAGTAIILSITASAVVSLALWAGAPLWASAWGVPDATWIVRVIAVTLLLTSAATIPVALIRRRLRFRAAAVLETSALVLGLATGVLLAAWLHSGLALALGQAAGGAAILVASSVTARHDLRLAFDKADARDLFGFASQVGGLNLLSYAAHIAPSWFAARAFGAAALGVYSRANLIVGLPSEYALTSIFKVLYPIYGRVREDLARTKILIDEALTLTTGLIWPILALIAGAAPVIVHLLLGDGWDAAATLITLFALMAAAWVPCGLLTNAAEGLGWMRIAATRQLAFFTCIAVTLAVGKLAGLSLNLIMLGAGISEWIVYALTLRAFISRQLLHRVDIIQRQLIHGALGVVTFAASAIGARVLTHNSLLVQVGAEVAIAAAVVGTIALGRRWFPATEILARRMGVPAGQSVLRGGWTSLRMTDE